MKLDRRLVPKPWGRTSLPSSFGATDGQRIGEVWFGDAGDLPFMAKYIFTSERLSIQNHPNDAQARERGLLRGKEECWYILEAEPDARLGLGFVYEVGRDEIREAAADGSIVELLDWKPVQHGDFFYVPAGTVHAIGAGISLLECQQNSDVTYRLYDYGRPRELHLDDGISVAVTGPYSDPRSRTIHPEQSELLVDGPHFSLAHVRGNDELVRKFAGQTRWVLPIDGRVAAAGDEASKGECLFLQPGNEIESIDGRAMILAERLVPLARL